MAGLRGLTNNYSFRFPFWDVNVYYPINSVVAYQHTDGSVEHLIAVRDVQANQTTIPPQDRLHWVSFLDDAYIGTEWSPSVAYRAGQIISYQGTAYVAVAGITGNGGAPSASNPHWTPITRHPEAASNTLFGDSDGAFNATDYHIGTLFFNSSTGRLYATNATHWVEISVS